MEKPSPTTARRRPERVARQPAAQHVRFRRTAAPDRSWLARDDEQSNDLREGDRRRQRLRRAARDADRFGEERRRAVLGPRGRGHPERLRRVRTGLRVLGGNDGFVSLEVSPLLANDTAGTIAMAEELWKRVEPPERDDQDSRHEGRPRRRSKSRSIAGYNINVTLIFSVEMYERAARAYIKGFERRVAEGKPVDKIRSVNSRLRQPHRHGDRQAASRRASPKARNSSRCSARRASPGLKLTYQKFKEIFLERRVRGAARQGRAPCSGRSGPRPPRRTPTTPT